MRTIVLDFNDFQDEKAVHAFLASRLDFPDYYGNNLDALYDVLSTEDRETNAVLLHTENPIAEGFLMVFTDAAAFNSRFTFGAGKKP